MAEGFLKAAISKSDKIALDQVRIESAGTGSWHIGSLPDRRSIAVAKNRGVVLDSRARQIAPNDFFEFDWIFALDQAVFDELEALRSGAGKPVKLLLDLVPGYEGRDVPDPYYGSIEDFERAADLIEMAIARLREVIESKKCD